MSEFSNDNLDVMYTQEQIQLRVQELGQKITSDYAGKEPVLIGVLKGSFIFLADLVRCINLPVKLDFMSVSSYKDQTVSTGDVEILKDITMSIRDRDVIIVEDIIDTGLTLYRLSELLRARGPRSVKIATLLDKPDPRVKQLTVDYCGFSIPNKFVIGYGLDYSGRYRNLPFIAVVKDPSKL